MSQERATIFETDELDLSGFAPKSKTILKNVDKAAIRKVAEQKGFPSREQVPDPKPMEISEKRQPRRYVTGRNRQLNLKVTDSAAERLYALADANRLVLGEAFEMAIEALERDLAKST
jgi:hypothetical protein